MREDGERKGSTDVGGVISCKGVWENLVGLSSASRISSEVSASESLKLEMVKKSLS